ncbi:MAG: recombination protein RecR [Candidatus Andersenbacteria bacterium]|nr:recombination protein RecR [Candidatus Andersenbacteria bacterium]
MYPKSITNLIAEFSKLPGIGPRTATRFVFSLLRCPDHDVELLGKAILDLKEETKICKNCFNISEKELCAFCSNQKRDRSIVCIIEEAINIPAIENTKRFNGLYHVLGGVIKPSEGISPDDLNIKELVDRIKGNRIKEVIIATNPNTEGETTALYLAKTLKPFNVKITRLARGLSTGSDLEYADEVTISSALAGRREYK